MKAGDTSGTEQPFGRGRGDPEEALSDLCVCSAQQETQSLCLPVQAWQFSMGFVSRLDPVTLFFCFWSSQGCGNCQDCGNLQKSSGEDALPAVWVCYLDFSNRGAQNSVWGVKSGLWV